MHLRPGIFACMQGLVKYLSAVTSRNWTGSDNNRGKSTSSGGGAADASMWSDAVEKLRQLMRGSKGKQLIELVEMLGGKPVSLKVIGGRNTAEKTTNAVMGRPPLTAGGTRSYLFAATCLHCVQNYWLVQYRTVGRS